MYFIHIVQENVVIEYFVVPLAREFSYTSYKLFQQM